MKILRIARKLPPCPGGQENHIIDLSTFQINHGNKVIINFGLGNHVNPSLGIMSKRITPKYLLSVIKIDVLQGFVFGLILIFQHYLQKKIKLDIVHVHGDIMEIFFSWLVSKRYKTKLIVTIHAGLSNKYWYKKIAPLILKLPDSIICVSPEIVNQIKKIQPKIYNIHYIHSGIFRNRFIPPKDYVYSLPLKVISVGRLHEMKGFKYLIKALANKKLKKLVHLTLIGDGPERKSLENLAKNINLNVEFLGNKSKEEIINYLHNSHLFVSSSIRLKEQTEGTPTVIMEAMAAGLPVISTNVGGAKFILQEKDNGFIIESKNQAIFIDTLLHFINNKNLSYQQSKNNISKSINFDWSKICLKISNVYKSALDFK